MIRSDNQFVVALCNKSLDTAIVEKFTTTVLTDHLFEGTKYRQVLEEEVKVYQQKIIDFITEMIQEVDEDKATFLKCHGRKPHCIGNM